MSNVNLIRLPLAALLLGCLAFLGWPAAASDASEAKLIKMVPPSYPSMALDRSIEGWVELEFVVDASGDVKQVSIVESEPARTFDSAAVRAVKKWKFEPAKRDGKPVDSQERKRLVFQL